MPHKNRKVRLRYLKQWREKNTHKIPVYRGRSKGIRRQRYATDSKYRKAERKRARATYHKFRRKNIKKRRAYYKIHRVKLLAQEAEKRRQLKLEMIAAYGGKCQCPGCKVKHPSVLTLEHKNGGGSKHRKLIGASHMLRHLKKLGWPSDYTVLCANCNHARGVYGKCPHELGEKL